ncbi:unnamed protein product [Cyprideis torosa]|uniref:Spermidine synthase n=1 Tax=Cyprideis torosa TaxID=163714 RepID=A0A7R8WIN4_9CRUS|nr:unnamed protein product [Cyprideis torosa]CAG0894675.1 unnamed protein product [Cyprideis torosa]
MNSFKDGWFSEHSTLWPGQCFSLAVSKVLHQEKSAFQDILVFQNEQYGRVLVLDGVIQLTEKDEASYQEMMAFLPITSHPNPEKVVLIVGGGDGGVAREVIKDPRVKSVTVCEIDPRVPEVCKEFFPTLSSSFSEGKVKLRVGDGSEYLASFQDEFDVIITDSSDPIGPAACLFEEAYFQRLQRALKPGGIFCSQGESMWIHMKIIQETMKLARQFFPTVSYATTNTPTYPCGQIGFLLGSKSVETDFKTPAWKMSKGEVCAMQLKYYTPEVHAAAFVLPAFAQKLLSD